MSVPAWSGYAVSPLWGVGSALIMEISSGADWSVPFYVFAVDGVTPLDVQNPIIEMRRDKSTGAQLMAHFDTTGGAGGLITMAGIGSLVLSMDAEHTAAMPSGRGFWDCFGTVNGQLVAVASGVVVVSPRVTASPGSGMPMPPATPPSGSPPVTVAVAPSEVNLQFRRGDDYRLDLTMAEDGAPLDLTDASVEAYCYLPGGQRLADFDATLGDSVIHLHLDDTVTATLPPSCQWECRLTRNGDESTIAAGKVTVT